MGWGGEADKVGVTRACLLSLSPSAIGSPDAPSHLPEPQHLNHWGSQICPWTTRGPCLEQALSLEMHR